MENAILGAVGVFAILAMFMGTGITGNYERPPVAEEDAYFFGKDVSRDVTELCWSKGSAMARCCKDECSIQCKGDEVCRSTCKNLCDHTIVKRLQT